MFKSKLKELFSELVDEDLANIDVSEERAIALLVAVRNLIKLWWGTPESITSFSKKTFFNSEGRRFLLKDYVGKLPGAPEYNVYALSKEYGFSLFYIKESVVEDSAAFERVCTYDLAEGFDPEQLGIIGNKLNPDYLNQLISRKIEKRDFVTVDALTFEPVNLDDKDGSTSDSNGGTLYINYNLGRSIKTLINATPFKWLLAEQVLYIGCPTLGFIIGGATQPPINTDVEDLFGF